MIRTVAMTEIHLRFSPIHPRAGSKLVTASADGSARVYNTITGACLAILTGHAGEISKIQFNPQVRTAPPRPPTGGYWVAVPRGPHPRRPNRQATPAPLLRGMSVSASKKIGNPRSIQRSERDNEDDVTGAVAILSQSRGLSVIMRMTSRRRYLSAAGVHTRWLKARPAAGSGAASHAVCAVRVAYAVVRGLCAGLETDHGVL
jgi:hypothetical protein